MFYTYLLLGHFGLFWRSIAQVSEHWLLHLRLDIDNVCGFGHVCRLLPMILV